MNSAIKIVVALLVAALIAVVGLIVLTNNSDAKAPEATTAPEVTVQPTQAAVSEATEVPAATSEPADTEEAEQSADNEAPAETETETEAQGTMYEGALAGLTEEEIAALAMAEESSHERTDETTGVEDPVD